RKTSTAPKLQRRKTQSQEKKKRIQKRYINDTLLNLYKSFIDLISKCHTLRPFWVVHKKVDVRKTCLFKLHENVKLRSEKLFRLKIIASPNTNTLIEKNICDVDRYNCAYGQCKECVDRKIPTTNVYTEKLEETDSVETLVEDTLKILKERYIKHVFNIKHQYRELKNMKDNLNESGCTAFSLHTVVVYVKDKTKSYCTISDNTQHGPGAIWAHMQPILKSLKADHPNVKNVQFVSDGPSTQYKSKNNFYLFHRKIIENYGFESATWNFTGTGHGKSSADVGCTVKRTADRMVSNGKDINDATALKNENVRGELKKCSISLQLKDLSLRNPQVACRGH
ncbi:hypothetical protein MAR_028888, partial [Mya arenaria]